MTPGAALGDRYALARRLGAGGMASVWLADDVLLGRSVAVKVIADTLALDEQYLERFSREARIAASVSHPGIVPVYDYGLDGDRPFLVMEYVPGGTLADVLADRRSAMPDPRLLAGELLSALECVHGAGLVHRDVKPANILLDASSHARLTDFGIARPDDATSLTQTGMVVGSIRYLAPEVVAGTRASAAADLYAAGVVLRELSDRNPSPGLGPLIAALTSRHPDDRPASAGAALRLLGDGATDAVSEPAPTRIAPIAPPPRPAAPRAAPPTRVQRRGEPVRRRGESVYPAGRRERGPLRVRLSPRSLAAALAAVLAVVVVVLAAGGGGGSPGVKTTPTSTPAPAAASAPLADQLASLKQLVHRATQP